MLLKLFYHNGLSHINVQQWPFLASTGNAYWQTVTNKKSCITHICSKTAVTHTFFQYLCDAGIVSFQFHLELGNFLVQFTQMPLNLYNISPATKMNPQ